MKIEKKLRRVHITLDGYSEYYHALIQGAVTGKVSLPAEYADKDEKELAKIVLECLRGGSGRYDAKIIKKVDYVR